MTTPLGDVIAGMRRNRAQMAVVMDEQGGTAGLITFEDLFEEVVGEIDEERRPLAPGPGGQLVVRGTVRLEEVGSVFGIPLDHPDVVTVSGLVLAVLQRPAAVGDVVTWQQVRFEVSAVTGRGVAEAIATASPRGPAP
jgi:CBS domain containing-hemolysin-like protein